MHGTFRPVLLNDLVKKKIFFVFRREGNMHIQSNSAWKFQCYCDPILKQRELRSFDYIKYNEIFKKKSWSYFLTMPFNALEASWDFQST